MSFWGPWIKHDGKGYPIRRGAKVRIRTLASDGSEHVKVVVVGASSVSQEHSSWTWKVDGQGRYQTYKRNLAVVTDYQLWERDTRAALSTLQAIVENPSYERISEGPVVNFG